MNHNIDQTYAAANENLDQVVQEWRESLARKKERHGEKFDYALALPHLYAMVSTAPPQAMASALAAAVNRLALLDNSALPLPDELAHLDFDFDPDKGAE